MEAVVARSNAEIGCLKELWVPLCRHKLSKTVERVLESTQAEQRFRLEERHVTGERAIGILLMEFLRFKSGLVELMALGEYLNERELCLFGELVIWIAVQEL